MPLAPNSPTYLDIAVVQPQPSSDTFYPFHSDSQQKKTKERKKDPPSADETRHTAFSTILTPSPILAMVLPNDVGHLFLAERAKKICLS